MTDLPKADGRRGRGVTGEEAGPATVVVNRRRGEKYDVYIGRGPGGTVPRTGRGMWGNPYRPGVHGTEEECIALFERYLREERQDLMDLIPTHIKGKRLGCTGAPRPCHGDGLVRLADETGE
jgi:hypothetical protein